MKKCFQLCLNNAQISYKTIGKNSSTQIQSTNTVGTIVYNIALSVFYNFSNWYCRRRNWRRDNCIAICNVNPVKLYNIYIKVDFDYTHSKFCCFVNSSKYCEYKTEGKNLTIKIPRLLPGEIFYLNFNSTGYTNKYTNQEKIRVFICGQVLLKDDDYVNIFKCYNCKY